MDLISNGHGLPVGLPGSMFEVYILLKLADVETSGSLFIVLRKLIKSLSVSGSIFSL